MRKNILLTALCLSLFSIAAQATLDRSNGFCLAQDGQNLYFSSPESMSFIVMDKTTGALSFYEQPGNSDATSNLCNVALPLDGTVLFSNTFGLQSFSKEKQSVSSLSRLGAIYAMAEAPDGSVWVGTADHYVGRITRSGVFDYSLYFGHEDKYANPGNMHITDMAFDAEGTLWFVSASDERTTLYRLKNGRLDLLPAPEGFPKGAQAVEVDAAGNVWYSTARALVKYDGREFSCYQVPAAIRPEGLKGQIKDFKFDAAGRIWILPLHGTVICAENIDKGEYSCYEYEEVDDNSSSLDGMMYLAVDGETVYAVGGRQKEKTTAGIARQRTLLLVVKDGRAACHEITESLAGKFPMGIGNIESGYEDVSAPAYDSQGRRLSTIPDKGIYIRNGRKFVR